MPNAVQRSISTLIAATVVLPFAASAEVVNISEVTGLFNILVGFMFVAAVSTFVGGIISYMVDFGNHERLKGIGLMEWGVAILFTLVVLLGIVQFIQSHQGTANVIVATAIIIGTILIVFTVLMESSPPEKKKEGGPPKA
jgi:cytochrome c oxidase subunit IV